MRSPVRRAVFGLLLPSALAIGVPLAGGAPAKTPSSAGGSAGGSAVVSYKNRGELANASRATIKGTPDGLGGCRFAFPKLTRPNGAPPVEARQVSTDFSNCTTVVETGTPTSVPADRADGATSAGTASRDHPRAVAKRTLQSRARAALTDTHHYRVTWYDIIGLSVNWVQSNITATISGTCVTSASGSWNSWWLTATGWGSHPVYSYINAPQCANRSVRTTTKFSNGAFCWPGTVWVYYNNVYVFRSYAAFSGWVDSTFEQNVFACPPLHWGGSLW
jgi:hypothetical protein